MSVDFYATERHFAEHLAPIWRALGPRQRGSFYLGPDLAETADLNGITRPRFVELPPQARRPTVAAAFGDLKRARNAGRPVILTEHGAGQGYEGVRSGSYIGAADRRGAVLVLVPGQNAAERQLAAQPELPIALIGCPKLDRWHRAAPRPRSDKPVIAVAFHWDAKVCAETRSGFAHFKRALYPLSRHYKLLGHGHPRIMGLLSYHYDRFRIEVVPNFEEVIARADVFVVDNSSTLFEFASLDRPVVLLNPPQYRRHVDHGLRFWEFADIGPQVSDPDGLVSGVERALALPDRFAGRRREAIADIYAVTDGTAAERAAEAIVTFTATGVVPGHLAPAAPVPAGTISDVLSWVGENQHRATRALAAERRLRKPRAGLIRTLEGSLA